MAALATRDATAMPPSGPWFGNGGQARLDRIPRFADAMIEVARALTESLGTLSASPGEVRFQGAETSRVDQLIDRKGSQAVFVLAQANDWNTTVAFHFDQPFVSVLMQAMFGGCDDDVEIPDRGLLSPVERRIAEVLADHTAEALAKGFADVLPSAFTVEPLKAKPDPSRLGKPSVPVTIATLVMRTIGPPVEIDVLIPQAALDAFDAELSAPAGSEETKTDPGWSEKLESEVNRTRMRLQARLQLPPMTLGAIARLSIGQVLAFAPGAGNDTILSSGGTELFRCALGQTDGLYSLMIEEEMTATGPSPHKDR